MIGISGVCCRIVEELMPKKHPDRVVNEIIERIDTRELKSSYKGGGTSAFSAGILIVSLFVFPAKTINRKCCR